MIHGPYNNKSLGILVKRKDNFKLKLAKIEHQEADWVDVGRVSNQFNDLINTVIKVQFP